MKKFLEYGIYLLVFLLPWQTRWIIKPGNLNGYSEYNTYSVYGTEILLWLIFILFIVFSFKKFKMQNSKCKISVFWFLSFLIFMLISTILALNPALAFYTLLKISEGAILAFLIYKLANFKKAVYIFSSGILMQAIIAIWQFFNQSVFSSKWFGMAFQDASNLGTSVIETWNERWLRAYGMLPHPNILAGYLAIAIFLLIILLMCEKNKFMLSTIIISSAALFLTFGRAAWISLLFSLSIFLFINIKNKINLKKIAFIISIIAIVPLIFSFIYIPLLKTRIGGETARLEEKSKNERTQSYREAMKIIKIYPFFGVGPGNYTLALKNKINLNLESFAYQPTHNIFLLLISEIGIIAFISLAILFILWIKDIFGSKFIILSPILILGLFDHYLISLYAGIMLSGFMFGLCLLSSKSKTIG